MVNDPFGGSMIPFGGLMDGQSLCDEIFSLDVKTARGRCCQPKMLQYVILLCTCTQVSRGDHENLAKRYDQVCAQVRALQHDKEQVQQDKQDLENKYYEEMKR